MKQEDVGAVMNTWCVDDRYGMLQQSNLTEAQAKECAQELANKGDAESVFTAYDVSVPYEPGGEYVFKKRSNTEFKVGDGVSWGFNGDTYPGTVERVTRSRVYVRRDQYKAVAPVPYGEQAEYIFTADPAGALETFTFRAPGPTGRF